MLSEGLVRAIAIGDLENVKSAITDSSDANARSISDGKTALMLASQHGQIEIVEYLVRIGAEVQTSNPYGWTALMFASYRGHDDVVRWLLNAGAERTLNARNQDGETALTLSAETGNLRVVVLLAESGADPNVTSDSNLTALMYAAHNGHLGVVKYLIDRGADRSVRDVQGRTAFDLALEEGCREVAEYLAGRA
jgi:serine/threonine-protein phosphatase 6 regulatory ankyrin repeat subunit B